MNSICHSSERKFNSMSKPPPPIGPSAQKPASQAASSATRCNEIPYSMAKLIPFPSSIVRALCEYAARNITLWAVCGWYCVCVCFVNAPIITHNTTSHTHTHPTPLQHIFTTYLKDSGTKTNILISPKTASRYFRAGDMPPPQPSLFNPACSQSNDVVAPVTTWAIRASIVQRVRDDGVGEGGGDDGGGRWMIRCVSA